MNARSHLESDSDSELELELEIDSDSDPDSDPDSCSIPDCESDWVGDDSDSRLFDCD